MATEQQIPKLAGLLVEHQDGFTALSTEEAQWVIAETKKAIALFVEAVKNRAKTTAKLLEFVGVQVLPAVKKFIAADHFKDGETVDGVKVSLGDNFKRLFLGKTEENVPECNLRVHKLTRASRDLGIRAEIGEEKEETYLAHLWHFLKLRGGKGGWFIFYIRDSEGILWAVFAVWRGSCWFVNAYSVGHPLAWRADFCVCSR